jgi:hypothetical protein
MSATTDHPMAGWTPLSELVEQHKLPPYRTMRPARNFLDRLQVPYIIICRQRHYQAADIREALDQRKGPPSPA